MKITSAHKILCSALRKHSWQPVSDAWSILAKILGLSAQEVFCLTGEYVLNLRQEAAMAYFCAEISSGRPIAQIIQTTEFYGQTITLTDKVLIPRLETEGLVELVLTNLPQKPHLELLEVGIGSGCVAAVLISTLLKRQISFHYQGIDVSREAVYLTKKNIRNAAKNVISKELIGVVRIAQTGLLRYTSSTVVDLIISNPPYLTTKEYQELDPSVKNFEPRLALDGGKDGLTVYRQIAKFAFEQGINNRFLPTIILEVSPTVGTKVKRLLNPRYSSTLRNDCFGRTRYLIARPIINQ